MALLTGCGGGFYETPYLGGNYETIYSNTGATGQAELNDDISYWDGDDPAYAGAPSMVINLSEQRAYFYQGDRLAGVGLVATGKENYGTPAGNFNVMEKIVDKRSNLYGWIYDGTGNVINYDADARTDTPPAGGYFEGADMPYWMRLTSGGVGMHQGPIPVPGQPASHGCIRVSKTVIRDFFNAAEVGMPVAIRY
ncbi:MAG: L,D-transpeptidase [Chthoniobacterales bacterium]